MKKKSASNIIPKIRAFIEYFLVIAPIGLYISFESYHQHNWHYLYSSPEWGIATIFLIFISVTNYVKAVRYSKGQLNETIIQLIVIGRMMGIILSTLITFMSVINDNLTLLIFRSFLFILSSIAFHFINAAAEIIKINNQNK